MVLGSTKDDSGDRVRFRERNRKLPASANADARFWRPSHLLSRGVQWSDDPVGIGLMPVGSWVAPGRGDDPRPGGFCRAVGAEFGPRRPRAILLRSRGSAVTSRHHVAGQSVIYVTVLDDLVSLRPTAKCDTNGTEIGMDATIR